MQTMPQASITTGRRVLCARAASVSCHFCKQISSEVGSCQNWSPLSQSAAPRTMRLCFRPVRDSSVSAKHNVHAFNHLPEQLESLDENTLRFLVARRLDLEPIPLRSFGILHRSQSCSDHTCDSAMHVLGCTVPFCGSFLSRSSPGIERGTPTQAVAVGYWCPDWCPISYL